MPIIIGCSSCFAWYSNSVSSWLFCSLHMHRLTIVHRLTCCVDSLTCISSRSSLSMVYIFIVFLSVYHGLCGHEWYTCTLLDCMVHDYPSSVWLHVACQCGPHIYHLTSNSLGFGHSFHPGSHYCKCETFCVLALWPSRRLGVGSSDGLYRCTGAFWRRATLCCRLESDHWRPV